MRQSRSHATADVDWIDVTLVEEVQEDEFLALLHELALEAIALRANNPGYSRPESPPPAGVTPAAGSTTPSTIATTWLRVTGSLRKTSR